jgi:putative ABC transport system substrate-binding protein
VVLATPVAQAAKNTVRDTPIVFMDITDPVEAGLLDHYDQAKGNITGVSDRQDLNAFLGFAKKILPHAKRIGLLYATGEANDQALVKMMGAAAKQNGMELVLTPIDQARDVPLRMQSFKGKVDFIYVGVSGPIQPSLPAIAAEADRMGIPIFNADKDAVYQHQVLASYGVSYPQIGVNAAHMVDKILKGAKPADIAPMYATAQQHEGYISQRKADKMGITIPSNITQLTIVE